jgi:hypothetical protein
MVGDGRVELQPLDFGIRVGERLADERRQRNGR